MPYAILHSEGRIERALGMVFVRDRRSEQGENAVAGRLYDMAVVMADRLDHHVESWINGRLSFLGVKFLHQLGRALDVREQGADRFALAVRYIGARKCTKPPWLTLLGGSWYRLRERNPAFAAEPFPGLVGRSTTLTFCNERFAALATEFAVWAIISSAVRTLHVLNPNARDFRPLSPCVVYHQT